MMRRNLINSFLALACLALVLVPVPVKAQSSGVGLTISVNPLTTSPGGTVGVFAFVTNNTGARLRTTVTFTSLSACGIQTNLGYNKVVLSPGQTVQVTVSYPLPPNACLGVYAISITAGSGGKTSSESSATAYLTVQ